MFHKIWGVSGLSEEILTSQDEGIFSMDLASWIAHISKVTVVKRTQKQVTQTVFARRGKILPKFNDKSFSLYLYSTLVGRVAQSV